MVGLTPIGGPGLAEVRATYGGLFVALGVFCITAQTEMVFAVAGVAWLGAAVGRAYSALVDRNYDIKNVGGFALEAALGALLVLPRAFA
jgi:hypothetical protein